MHIVLILLVVLGLIWLFSKRSAVKTTVKGLHDLGKLTEENGAAHAEAALVLAHLYGQYNDGLISDGELMAAMWLKYPDFMNQMPEPNDPSVRAAWRQMKTAMGQ